MGGLEGLGETLRKLAKPDLSWSCNVWIKDFFSLVGKELAVTLEVLWFKEDFLSSQKEGSAVSIYRPSKATAENDSRGRARPPDTKFGERLMGGQNVSCDCGAGESYHTMCPPKPVLEASEGGGNVS